MPQKPTVVRQNRSKEEIELEQKLWNTGLPKYEYGEEIEPGQYRATVWYLGERYICITPAPLLSLESAFNIAMWVKKGFEEGLAEDEEE